MTKWKLVPVEPTRQMINAAFMGMTMGDLPISGVYADMLKATPPPPKLSDERIFDLLKQVDPHAVRLPLGFKQFAIAIEREILGGGHD